MTPEIISFWQSVKPLIQQGYQALDKEIAMGLPGACMPAISDVCDTGIGSPYGMGAKRVHHFFNKVVHKIILGPGGKTTKKSGHSPYMSAIENNPFFIPLDYLVRDKLLDKKILDSIYAIPKTAGKIDFNQVELAYKKALAPFSDKKIQELTIKYINECQYPYVGDFQVMIPHSLTVKNKACFLPHFTLGAPKDNLCHLNQRWGFKMLHPGKIFKKDKTLGIAGHLLFTLFDKAMRENKGGLRIDHFIGMVNPYAFCDNEKYDNGRVYSSPHHLIFKNFTKKSTPDFANITTDIILKAANKNNLSPMDIYPEDIGTRPPEIDNVLNYCGLGRMLVSQFVDIDDDNHIYRLKNAQYNDIATLNTHDMESLYDFVHHLNDYDKEKHARKLCADLRWHYNDSIKSDKTLMRLKWGELLMCKAKRVQAFFTSFTGQQGRYNLPGLPAEWSFRCQNDFDRLYFDNLRKGLAYNPFDAICLAIFARGDDFYQQHQALVHQLRGAEKELFHLLEAI